MEKWTEEKRKKIKTCEKEGTVRLELSEGRRRKVMEIESLNGRGREA